MPTSSIDVAIVGAGPYGLALAAHLADRGVEHRIFGPPMEAWRSMSAGMHLKSLGFATNIFTPDDYLSLPQFCRARGEEDSEPIPIATFADYGMTVQRQVVPQLEEVKVANIRARAGPLQLDARDGRVGAGPAGRRRHWVDVLRPDPGAVRPAAARSCVPYVPAQAISADSKAATSPLSVPANLPCRRLPSSTSTRRRFVVVARRSVHWGSKGRPDAERSLVERVRVPVTVLGHGRDNWVLQHLPSLQHYMSDDRRLQFLHTHLGPGGAWWLRDRVEGTVSIETDTEVVEAVAEGDKVRLTLVQGGEVRELLTEFVVVGTGYDVNVDRIGFIEPAVGRQGPPSGAGTRCCRGSSNPRFSGLYFVGPSSMASFGPLFRFVAGSKYTVAHLARHLSHPRLGAVRAQK